MFACVFAGRDADCGNLSGEKYEITKLNVTDYNNISFPRVSISEEELSNYLENNNAIIQLEFENPVDKEIKFKVRLDDWPKENNDFQNVTLKPFETKQIEYICKPDPDNYTRELSTSFWLNVINDYVGEETFKSYYHGEGKNLTKGIVIYIGKFIRVEDLIL